MKTDAFIKETIENLDQKFSEEEKPFHYSYVDESYTTRASEALLDYIAAEYDFERDESKRDSDSLASALILELFLDDLQSLSV